MSIERFSGAQSEQPDGEPKLIIDEDWKTQVQREKEILKQKQNESRANSSNSGAQSVDADSGVDAHTSTVKQSQGESQKKSASAPPASFEYLVSGMATQALAAMGQIPNEDGKPYPTNLDYAKHYIDLLGVLESKTKGNLSNAEQRFLQDALHQLRMLFVAIKNG